MLPDNVFKLRLKGTEKCITKGGSSCLDEMCLKPLCKSRFDDGNGVSRAKLQNHGLVVAYCIEAIEAIEAIVC